MYIPMEAKQRRILSDENNVNIFGDQQFQMKNYLYKTRYA